MDEETRNLARAALDSAARLLADLKDDGQLRLDYSPAPATPAAGSAPAAAPAPAPRREAPPPPPPPPPPPVAPVSEPRKPATTEDLASIAAEIAGCKLCPLHTTRHRTVPGQGHPHPELMFIGEGPGTDEDRQGLAFVGRAGQLLTRIITRMGFTRDQVFIGNIVKCRPTVDLQMQRDRPPTEEEMSVCIPYLKRQIAVLQPKVIVALGATALLGLLGKKGISRLRGQWFAYEGIPLMPTYHPSYLLRGGGDEKERYWEVWDDMVKVLEKIGRPAPAGRDRKP